MTLLLYITTSRRWKKYFLYHLIVFLAHSADATTYLVLLVNEPHVSVVVIDYLRLLNCYAGTTLTAPGYLLNRLVESRNEVHLLVVYPREKKDAVCLLINLAVRLSCSAREGGDCGSS